MVLVGVAGSHCQLLCCILEKFFCPLGMAAEVPPVRALRGGNFLVSVADRALRRSEVRVQVRADGLIGLCKKRGPKEQSRAESDIG